MNLQDIKNLLNDKRLKQINLNYKFITRQLCNRLILKNISKDYNLRNSEIIYLLLHKNELEKLHIFCPICGKKNMFCNSVKGYFYHCSTSCSSCDPNVIKASKNTRKIRYNNENYTNFEQSKDTLYNNYKVTSPMKSQKLAKRQVESCRKNWPKENYNNRILAGNTSFERFGSRNIFSSQKQKNKYKDKEWVKQKQQKEYESKKRNGTLRSSESENIIHQLLLYKFDFEDIIPQYKDKERYNFACDFYIKSLDLFIEINFYWTHGYEPFNYNNIEHLKLLKHWIEESNNINFKNEKKKQYKKAMYIWTIDDVNKFKTAKQNKLNYIAFYNLEQFLDWLCPLIDTPDN